MAFQRTILKSPEEKHFVFSNVLRKPSGNSSCGFMKNFCITKSRKNRYPYRGKCAENQNITVSNLTQSLSYWFPRNQTKGCFIMLVINLRKPEWLSADCNKALLPDFFCVSQRIEMVTLEKILNKSLSCPHTMILKVGLCYDIRWVENMKSDCLWSEEAQTTSGKQDFLTGFLLSPIVFQNCTSVDLFFIEEYEKVTMTFQTRTVKSKTIPPGFYVWKHPSIFFKTGQHNVFKCKSGTYISVLHLCDKKTDCLTILMRINVTVRNPVVEV